MKERLLVLFLSVLVCAFSAAGQNVNESESSIVINEKSADVTLAIESNARRAEVPVELTMLDPSGIRRAFVSQPTQITAGKRKYRFSIPLGEIMKSASEEIA